MPLVFLTLSMVDVVDLVRRHPVPFVFLMSLLFFKGVEYTIPMVQSTSQPSHPMTKLLHAVLVVSHNLNSGLAALDTVSLSTN
jgi:hypothetical protein